MPNHDGFLAQVIARPAADGPRLIYADWLDEHGDPRGQFIRLQCALARLPADDPDRPALKRRQQELQKSHAATWSAPFAGKAIRCTFRRGFVEGITLTARAFVEHGEELFAMSPVRSVRLTKVSDNVEVLANCAALARVAELDLTGNELGDAAMRRFLQSRHLKQLTALSLGANGLTDQVMRTLNSESLPALVRLDLSHNHVRDPASLALLPALVELDFSHNEVMPIPSVFLDRDIRLNVAGNPLGDAGARPIIENPRLLAGGRLDLSGCGLSAATVSLLVSVAAQAPIRTLVLDHNELGDAGVQMLFRATGFDQLRVVRLVNVGATDAAATVIAHSPLFPQLLRLDLRENRLSSQGVDLLWNSDRRHPQSVLELADNMPPPPVDFDRDDDAPIRLAGGE